jgi:deoxyadenosine/deoxycytidine kinase
MYSSINVAIIGTIGVGKSTFIQKLNDEIKSNRVIPTETIVYGEPSVSIDFFKEALKKFYKNTKNWAYPLQLGVSAAQEINHQSLKDSNYDVAIVDAPYSSYMYCNIHVKAGRMSEEEKNTVISISRPFPYDIVILIEETAEVTIDRIMKRNRSIELNDLLYLHEHIRDYKEFQEEYISTYFPGAEVIRLSALPDDSMQEYNDILKDTIDKIFK